MRLILGALVAAILLLGGCTVEVLAPEVDIIHEHDEVREPFIELDVVRAGNTYWTNTLDIFDNRLALECIRFKVREQMHTVSALMILMFTYEGWKCYEPELQFVDVHNAAAAVFYVVPPFDFDPWSP